MKYDGYRLLAALHRGQSQLTTRNGADATKWFPEVAAGVATMPGGPHLIDGEVCVLEESGRSEFVRLDRAGTGVDRTVGISLVRHVGRLRPVDRS